ncbi:class I adenylate-forming enzyme family protein [Propylenella binzhouense]|uniref:Long-chain fatty acid--CoA ligase n=1 Tax=Propylenella binzhouense TaxID=2555902 RepID=A0A964T529_9HYPH|nr:AMP-binding protein [Propylenella binzhouense]MYZ48310.1 long-chain fatty acid--CoA ligase [Propylenella binzhouense]
MHVGYHLNALARRWPDRPAIVEGGRSCTYAAFATRLNRLGNALFGLGLARGDRVALLVPDCREYLEADYGIMSAGLVRVPLDPRLSRQELASQMADAGVRALITHAAFAGKVEELGPDRPDPVIAIGGSVPGALRYEDLLARASTAQPPLGAPDDLATLNYSGGTTGAPKATMLAHRSLMSAAQNVIMGFGIGPDDVFLNVRPLWPIAQILAMSHILAGSPVVLGGRFDPERLPALVRETGATRSSLVPTLLVRLLEHHPDGHPDLGALDAIYVGGSRIPAPVFEHAVDALGPRIGVLYGLTEAPVSCYLRPDDLRDPDRVPYRVRSAGRPLFGYDLAIRDAGGAILPAGSSGEITLRGPNMMLGYWNRPAETAAALRDGWLHTGDIGELDEEGFLFVVGRLKEIIRTGSSSVRPDEVEGVLLGHPAIAEAAVVGLPDREWGEIVTAFIVLRDGAAADSEALAAFCRDRLTGFKRPRRFEFVGSLPRSHYGKVLKKQLLEGIEG